MVLPVLTLGLPARSATVLCRLRSPVPPLFYGWFRLPLLGSFGSCAVTTTVCHYGSGLRLLRFAVVAHRVGCNLVGSLPQFIRCRLPFTVTPAHAVLRLRSLPVTFPAYVHWLLPYVYCRLHLPLRYHTPTRLLRYTHAVVALRVPLVTLPLRSAARCRCYHASFDFSSGYPVARCGCSTCDLILPLCLRYGCRTRILLPRALPRTATYYHGCLRSAGLVYATRLPVTHPTFYAHWLVTRLR